MDGYSVLVTGGAGFLGSHFVRLALAQGAGALVNVDILTYAGDPDRLVDLADDPRYRLVKADVASSDDIGEILTPSSFDLVVHYAAESHVTRSEKDPERFHRTNLEGTKVMLDAAVAADVKRFVHISTDEVYGSILEGAFKEEDKGTGTGSATSPYAQSKALADELALSYADKIEVVVARPTNAFGPWQYPEKAFPRWATRAIAGDALPVWGDGLYIRQWLFAEDFARAIALLAAEGKSGQAYNVGPLHKPEITNIDLVRWLVGRMGIEQDRIEMTAYDRPDHDRRYAVDPTKIMELGWQPGDVWEQLDQTVTWFEENEDWWRKHVAEAESIYKESKA